jgi:hypothetical protein
LVKASAPERRFVQALGPHARIVNATPGKLSYSESGKFDLFPR